MNERNKFILLNTLKNFKRQKIQYILIGILVLTISILTVTSLIVMVPAGKIVEIYRPRFTQYGAYMPDELAERVESDLSINEVRRSESVYVLLNQIVFGTVIIGVSLLLFIFNLLINVRIYDIGILYSIGFNKKSIFISILLEIGGFIITLILLGIIVSIITILVLSAVDIIPQYFNQYFAVDIILIGLILQVIVSLTLLPSLILLVRIQKSSPLKLLRERT